MKLFLIFCFAVVFFTGCNRNDQRATVNGPKDAQTSSQKVKKAKPVPAEVATEISNTLQILTEMSGVYNQIYQLLTNTRNVQPAQNVFQVLMKNILVDYNIDGQPKDKPLKEAVCKTGKPHLNSTETAPGSKQYTHELYFNHCDGQQQADKLAKWSINSSGNYQFTFEISSMLATPNTAYGDYGRIMRNLGKVSQCVVTYDPNKKVIAAMTCENLTHDYKLQNQVSATHYVRFDKIEYSRNRVGPEGQPKPLKVTGAIVDYAGVEKPDEFKVEDEPRLNEFHIDIYKVQDPTTNSSDRKPSVPDATGTGDNQGLAPQNQPGNSQADPNVQANPNQQGQQNQPAQPNQQGQVTNPDNGGQPADPNQNSNTMQSDTIQSGDSRDQQQQPGQISGQQKNMARPRSLSQSAPLGYATQGQDGQLQEEPQVRP